MSKTYERIGSIVLKDRKEPKGHCEAMKNKQIVSLVAANREIKKLLMQSDLPVSS